MKKIFLVLIISLICISFVSAVWYNPLTWFQSNSILLETNPQLEIISSGQQWNVLKSEGEKSGLIFWTANRKDKKTELGWIPTSGSCSGWSDKYIYNENNNKNKDTLLRCESGKCDGQSCYHISLTNAQAINIDNYVKLGENSLIAEYQDINLLNYHLDFADINITLYKNISNNWDNTVNEIFVYHNKDSEKFGANDSLNDWLENYKYKIESTAPIQNNENLYYVLDPESKGGLYKYHDAHTFDFSDICDKQFECKDMGIGEDGLPLTICGYEADCKFNQYEENGLYKLEVTFLSDKDIDPVITIGEADVYVDGLLDDVLVEEGNFSHLNISDNAPYSGLVAYWSFDGDKVNTALTNHFDLTEYDNDGYGTGTALVNSTSGLYDNGLWLDGNSDMVTVPYSAELYSDTMSVSFWAKSTKTNYASNGYVVSMYEFKTSQRTWGIMIDKTTDNWAIATGRGTSGANEPTSQDVELGWHHITAVLVNNSIANWSFYYDGVYIQSLTADFVMLDTNSDITIGGLIGSSTAYFSGDMDEIMLFDRTLTTSEVTAIYNNQSARFKDSGTMWLNDQELLGIDSGYNRVNVSTTLKELLGSDVNLSVGYYDGSWHDTDMQTITSGINHTFEITTTTTNLTLNYTLIAGNYDFYTPIIYGDIILETFLVSEEDTTPPTYSLNQTNSTIAGESTLFSLYWNDDTALETNGEYIFSTNNTGTWTNDSAINFTSTPEWANVTKVLNNTVGNVIGYRWYATDNAGNLNASEVFSLVTTGGDTCTYTSGNWDILCSDNCAISSPVDLGGNDITITGTGTFTTTADISNWGKIRIEGTDQSNICRVKCDGGCFR